MQYFRSFLCLLFFLFTERWLIIPFGKNEPLTTGDLQVFSSSHHSHFQRVNYCVDNHRCHGRCVFDLRMFRCDQFQRNRTDSLPGE